MIVKRKLFSVIDEEGNLGYYLYNEATGEEKLFSVVEEEREFASVKALKKAGNTIVDKAIKGKLTTKDIARAGRLKGRNSLKAVENPHYSKVAKAGYNKMNQITKGEFGKSMSKDDFVKQSREAAKTASRQLGNRNPKKGEVKALVDTLNQASR